MRDEDESNVKYSTTEVTFTYVQPTDTRAGKTPDLEHLVSFAQRCVEEAGRHHAAEFMRAIGMEQVGDTVPIDPETALEIESMIHFEEHPKFKITDLVELTYDGGTDPMQKFLRADDCGAQLSPCVRAQFGLDGAVAGYSVAGPGINSVDDAMRALSDAVKSSLMPCPVCKGYMVWEACDVCGDVGYVLGKEKE